MMTATKVSTSNFYTGVGLVDALRWRRCKHNFVRTHRSNVLQLDDFGYPLRLFITTCTKCGCSQQQWFDVSSSEMDELGSGKSTLLRWTTERREVDR